MTTPLLLICLFAAAPLPPLAQDAVARVSAQECRVDLETLTGFGTRHTLSDTVSTTRGIGAARRWIHSRLAANARLQVTFEEFEAPKMPRLPDGAQVVNVVARLPGHAPQASRRVVYVVGHYDTINGDKMNAADDAPGANDDASGTTVMLECARAAAELKLDATVVFLATCAEEQGLVGAKYHAQSLAASRAFNQVYVLSNDIVGDPSVAFEVPPGAAAAPAPSFVRVFSESFPRGANADELSRIRTEGLESDSDSRQLARYVAYVAQRERLSLRPKLIFRQDRFLRGGDHSAFNEAGFAAVRFSVPAEDYSRQHATVTTVNGKPYGDTQAFVDPEYVAQVARLNLAALVHLANAPSHPENVRVLTKELTPYTQMKWDASPDADVAGYEVVVRETTSPDWETVINTGTATEYQSSLSKDNYIFGVRAYDTDGYRSVVRVAIGAKE